MGFRFSKRVKILPGVSVNLSKSGASLSLGGKGAKVNVGKKGVRTTIGAPGSGLSYSTYTPYNPGNSQPMPQRPTRSAYETSAPSTRKSRFWPAFLIFCLFSSALMSGGKVATAIAPIALIVFVAIAFYAVKAYRTPEEVTNFDDAELIKTCPFCAEDIKAAAIVCRHCQRDLPKADQG